MKQQTEKDLKKQFINASVNEFEALTFGELEVTQKFIVFPLPGDNEGHGGFKKTHWIFEKINDQIDEILPGIPCPKDVHYGLAVNTKTKIESNFSPSMLVILVE